MSKKAEAMPREPSPAPEVKVDAAKRSLSRRKLFGEMLALYKTKKTV